MNGAASRQIEPVSAAADAIAKEIVDAAYVVHRALGPGLLENVYEICLAHEIAKRGIDVQRQVTLPVTCDAIRVEAGLRLDLLVANCVIVEVKAVEDIDPIHTAQVLTYLRLAGHRLGLLINFNVPMIKQGIKRIVL